ncbi:unnamed protein product [Prunus brigantina]
MIRVENEPEWPRKLLLKPEKAVKVSTVMDTKNRLSAKINYEALDKLNEELGYAPALEEGTKSNCGSLGDMQLSNEKNSHDDEFEHESNGYSEKDEARQGQDDDSYSTELALAVKPFRFSINSSFDLFSLVLAASSSGPASLSLSPPSPSPPPFTGHHLCLCMIMKANQVLRNTLINGSIPTDFGEYQRLQILDLGFNNLTGELPSSLFNMIVHLTFFLFLCFFVSSFFFFFFFWVPPTIDMARFLGNNSLSGPLPIQKSNQLQTNVIKRFVLQLFLRKLSPMGNHNIATMDNRRWQDLEMACLVKVFEKVGMESVLLDVPSVCKSWYKATLNPSCWQCLIFPDNERTEIWPWDDFECPDFQNLMDRFASEFQIDGDRFSVRSSGLLFCLSFPNAAQ